jgi:hypothetical protein
LRLPGWMLLLRLSNRVRWYRFSITPSMMGSQARWNLLDFRATSPVPRTHLTSVLSRRPVSLSHSWGRFTGSSMMSGSIQPPFKVSYFYTARPPAKRTFRRMDCWPLRLVIFLCLSKSSGFRKIWIVPPVLWSKTSDPRYFGTESKARGTLTLRPIGYGGVLLTTPASMSGSEHRVRPDWASRT